MSEYLIQGETLTGIADKIRPLLGLTGTMTPEQMQTNLTTEQANITAALAALAEKGVEVPEGANSNALAGLIAAIEAGGDVKLVYGVVTPTEDISKQMPLFETENSYSGVPDALFVFYYPESSVETIPPINRCNASLSLKYYSSPSSTMPDARTLDFVRLSGGYRFPMVSKSSSILLYKAIKSGVLQFPYSESVFVFNAGEPYYYLAVYAGEDMRG